MTSLMDVMFLVLVFFIYCILDMSVHRGIKVDLPAAEGAVERGERIVITIAADDTMQFNSMTMPKSEILNRLKTLKDSKSDFPVIISGDRESSLGAGIELLSELKAMGFEKVTFQVAGEKVAQQ
jgi:biopolymer transport protein ExbD